MKNNWIILLIILSLIATSQTFSQSKKEQKQQREYLSTYERNTLPEKICRF